MEVPLHIFRPNDIRGIYGREITPELALNLGRALGSEVDLRDEIIIGHDMRTSGPLLAQALASGVMATGINVRMMGLITTPLLYFATIHSGEKIGVMVTASHLPLDHNGFKIARGGVAYTYDTLISKLEARVSGDDYRTDEWKLLGSLSQTDLVGPYLDYLKSKVHPGRPLRVVADLGSGSCWFAGRAFENAGFQVETLNPKPDGLGHGNRVDPLKPETLTTLRHRVLETGADLGVAVDPDADRVGFVDDRGRVVLADHVAIVLAESVMDRISRPKVLLYFGLSSVVIEYIKNLGADVQEVRPGHSYIQQAMIREDAVFASEANGHYYLADDFYGFDDGLFVALRVAEAISKKGEKFSSIIDGLPKQHLVPSELHIPVPEIHKEAIVDRLSETFREQGLSVKSLFGVKVETKKWWFLVRPSATESSLVVRYGGVEKVDAEEARELLEEEVNSALKGLGTDRTVSIPGLSDY